MSRKSLYDEETPPAGGAAGAMRLLIVDDHVLFRDSLTTLLTARGFEVAGVAGTGSEALEMAARTRPDVVLMDLEMPGMGGLEATRRICADLPDVKVVVLTASDAENDLFEAIKSGAQGYLLKSLDSERFFSLLEGVARGEPAITPSLARRLLQELASPAESQRDPDALTAREQEVLELMVQGVATNSKLAATLGVSENTIKFHVRNILDKLHLNNRAQAVGYALRNRLVDPES